MPPFNRTLFLCLLFVSPVVVYVSWKVWVWYILQKDLERMEEGLRMQEEGEAEAPPAAVPAAPAAT